MKDTSIHSLFKTENLYFHYFVMLPLFFFGICVCSFPCPLEI
uniref:Uncharacterized protein n=1 Tax=Arundo donax TaxID=35708 RepID=A0A0A9C5F3_ARUDO